MPRPRYPSDLSDAEWAPLEPPLSRAEKRGRPPEWSTRRVADGVSYLLRSGCSWRMLPREYPPWQTVYHHFRKWRIDGRLRRAHDRPRGAVREAEGRDRDPSAAVIDSRAVKTTRVGGPERGYGGAERLAGRKRRVLVDTNGLVLAARVHGAHLCPTGTAGGYWSRACGKNRPGWSWRGPTGRTRPGFASGPKESEGGGSRYRTIATGSCGGHPPR